MKRSLVVFQILFLLISINNVIVAQNKNSNNWNFTNDWKNETIYSKTYVVNQRHPAASDANPGTEALPLLTVNKAAQLVKPGARVLIYSGVYREMIHPKYGRNRCK